MEREGVGVKGWVRLIVGYLHSRGGVLSAGAGLRRGNGYRLCQVGGGAFGASVLGAVM